MDVVQSPSSARASSYRERIAAGVESYATGARPELLRFLESMHGQRAHQARPEYVSWLWEGQSLRAGMPQLWVYRHEGTIVAEQGAVPVALKVGRTTVKAAWAIHLLVDPKHQLRGVGAVLSNRCFAEYDLVLGLEVSDAARRAFRRAGWIDLGTVPLFVRILDPVRALAKKWPNRSWTGPAAQLARFPLGVVDALVEARSLTRRLEAEEVERFDTGVDFLFERAADAYPVIGRRDSSTLNWRFVDYPEPRRYRRLVFRHRGELVGYAVLRLDRDGAPLIGHVVDWLATPDWAWFVLARCITLLKRWGAAIAYCLNLGPTGASALRQLGFIERDSGWPLMFRAKELPYEVMALLCRRDSWFITAGDSDVDRPREHTIYPDDLDWNRSPSGSAPADRPRRIGRPIPPLTTGSE